MPKPYKQRDSKVRSPGVVSSERKTQKNLPVREHRWRSRYSPRSLRARRAGPTFLCFQLQNRPWHRHTPAHRPARQRLEVWHARGLSHPADSKKGQGNSSSCPQFQKVPKVNPLSATTTSSSRNSNINIGSVPKINFFPGGERHKESEERSELIYRLVWNSRRLSSPFIHCFPKGPLNMLSFSLGFHSNEGK